MYFASPLNGSSRGKTTIMGLPGRQRSLTVCSALWVQRINVTDRRTDGRTPGDSKYRAYAERRAVKTFQFKTHCKVDSHSSENEKFSHDSWLNAVTCRSYTWYSNSTSGWLKALEFEYDFASAMTVCIYSQFLIDNF